QDALPVEVSRVEVLQIKVADIIVEKQRGRKDFNNLPALMKNIEKHGLLHAVVVLKREDGKYSLIAGERRFRCVCLLGWETISASLMENLSQLQLKEIELDENLHRENLTWSEESELYRQIDETKRKVHGSSTQGAEKAGWNIDKTAKLVGKKKSMVAKQIKFAKLLKDRPDIQKKVAKLPLGPAMKKTTQILELERLKRLEEAGQTKQQAELKLGSAVDLIKELKNDSIDLVVTDPPFGNTVIEQDEGDCRGASKHYTAMLTETDNMNEESVEELMRALVPELFRVMKPSSHIYMFFSFNMYTKLHAILEEAGFILAPVPLIWDKKRTTSAFMGYDYAPCYEPILFACKPPRERRLTKPDRTILSYSTLHSSKKKHPFQKPQPLLQKLVSQSSKFNEVVLDPFAGSGSTLIAASTLKRSFIGFEINEKSFLVAQSYLGEVLKR
ncbi:MAG: DNA methyltransferase, partial [Candidatus Thorarchaeota archaeon]